MKINSHDNQLPQIRQTEPGQRLEKEAADRKQAAGGQDSVRISNHAREVSRITAEVGKVPDIREDRVRELKAAIEAGTYKVSGHDVAEKMIREHILGSIL